MLSPAALRPLILGLLLCTLTSGSIASGRANNLVIEEVVVTGKRPGPPLWQVTKGDHTLWLFGTPRLIPKSLNWDSASVDWMISQSHRYIAPPQVMAQTSNPIKAMGVMSDLAKLKRLPKGLDLETVVGAPLYRDLVVALEPLNLKPAKLSRLRPMFAAEKIQEQGLKVAGLRVSERIERTLQKMVKRHDVPVIETTSHASIDEMLDVLSTIPMESEIACLATTVDSIRTDLAAASSRALAWAEGDVTALQKLNYPDVNASCSRGIYNTPSAAALRVKTRRIWLEAAMDSLATFPTTFASLPIEELVRSDGLLSDLRQRGYQVRGQ